LRTNIHDVALTISGDGTTIKHLNYESKHITLQVPNYQSESNMSIPPAPGQVPTTHFFGISSAPNHMSEMQLDGWNKAQDAYYAI
jgi:hypothetical protein